MIRKWKTSHLRLRWMNFRHRIVFRIGSRRKPLPAELNPYPGLPGGAAVCPRCGDYLYTRTQCLSCGQRIIWDGE